MQTLLKFTSEQQMRLRIFVLLVFMSTVAISMLVYRNANMDSHEYRFLVFNLNLAWMPLILSTIIYASQSLPKPLNLLIALGGALVWLFFLPNAPYMLTDFENLLKNNDAPIWYDVLMIAWFAWTALLVGIYSIFQMQELVTKYFGAVTGWLFTGGIVILSSLGVYLGRFLRWYSWDILRRPEKIVTNIFEHLASPQNQQNFFLYTGLLSLLSLAVYVTFFLFGQLVNANKKDTAPK